MKNFKMIVTLSGWFDAPNVFDNKNENIPGSSSLFFGCAGVDADADADVDAEILFLYI